MQHAEYNISMEKQRIIPSISSNSQFFGRLFLSGAPSISRGHQKPGEGFGLPPFLFTMKIAHELHEFLSPSLLLTFHLFEWSPHNLAK